MPQADEKQFWETYEHAGPQAATAWLHEQSRAAGLIHADGTSSGTHWVQNSMWGPICITVNEAKPEKDPRDIAAAAEHTSENPQHDCVFCWNGPYEHRHLRMPLTLQGERYSLHFSPYAYFPEHCIVATEEHRPMKIDRRTFEDLLDLCDMFPQYFFGSNADLPIVGGSILAHHHYQGGNFAFPIDSAPIERPLHLEGAPDVTAGLLRWPLAVIRLESPDKESLIAAASCILDAWRAFGDPKAQIVAYDEDGTPHNTITPIARKIGNTYRLDLALRNNCTNEQYPLGVFHPHAEVHRVKKENIGLIEVMGLAILPPRVGAEFNVSGTDASDREEVGSLFVRGLEQCRVPVSEGFLQAL